MWFYLLVVLLALACVLFVTRVMLVIWRHIRQPVYQDANPEATEPEEIAKKKTLFL